MGSPTSRAGMRQLYLSVLVVTWAAYAYCATNHHSGAEQGNVHFNYDPLGKYLVAMTTSRCFFVKLNREEQDHVHTNIGMEDLELKMLREMLGSYPEMRIYHDNATLTTNLKQWCRTRDIYWLERSLEELGTTMPTIIG